MVIKWIQKINGENREIEDITEKCLSLIKSRKYSRPPTLMRIALIDATDSNICKDLGRYIAEVFNVIHSKPSLFHNYLNMFSSEITHTTFSPFFRHCGANVFTRHKIRQ